MSSEVVSLRREGAIAVITANNPPVNALGIAVRRGLQRAFAEAREDPSVEAVVLACEGRTFFAGADITEFNKPVEHPTLIEVIADVEAMPKVVVAALHGTPLGGGFEIALGCNYRIAAKGTRVGLPEIKLGLLPGAGGTQRLPRLIGLEKALAMILSGDPIPAEEAVKLGAVDRIAEGDLLQAAIAMAREAVAEKWPLRRARDVEDKLADIRANPQQFDAIAAPYMRKARGLHAPIAAVDCVRMVLDVPFDEAQKRERDKFMELRGGEQSKAQRHVFFAEREAGKVPGIGKDVKPREVNRAVVIGAGTMGGGISMSFANAGIPVTVIETGAEQLQRGLGIMEKNYKASAARGGITEAQAQQRFGLITGTTDWDAIKEADIVIEAVFEEMDLKRKVFAELDRLAKPGAVLATNTSYLDVNEIGRMTKRPESALGMHFFSPANVMKLLEIVRADATAPDVLATAMAVGRRIGKVPVVVGVCHGFVGNRMLGARSIEAERLLLEGALPQDVDRAIVEFGFPMGPFAMGDLAGLDVGWRNRKSLGQRAEIADALCEAGHYGQKIGRGFYRYEGGSRTPIPDDEVERIILEASKRLNIPRRNIDKVEIVERLIFPMINEGARILEEGIALRASDIDVIWIYGYGWPAWRGGPMYYADQVGAAHIRDRLAEFARRSNDPRLQPAALLERFAKDGGTFGAYNPASKAA